MCMRVCAYIHRCECVRAGIYENAHICIYAHLDKVSIPEGHLPDVDGGVVAGHIYIYKCVCVCLCHICVIYIYVHTP